VQISSVHGQNGKTNAFLRASAKKQFPINVSSGLTAPSVKMRSITVVELSND